MVRSITFQYFLNNSYIIRYKISFLNKDYCLSEKFWFVMKILLSTLPCKILFFITESQILNYYFISYCCPHWGNLFKSNYCISFRFHCPVNWGCRIHWLYLCRGGKTPPDECPRYDTKQSDGEVPAVLELWGMWSTPLLPSLPGPLWPGVVAPDRALSMS